MAVYTTSGIPDAVKAQLAKAFGGAYQPVEAASTSPAPGSSPTRLEQLRAQFRATTAPEGSPSERARLKAKRDRADVEQARRKGEVAPLPESMPIACTLVVDDVPCKGMMRTVYHRADNGIVYSSTAPCDVCSTYGGAWSTRDALLLMVSVLDEGGRAEVGVQLRRTLDKDAQAAPVFEALAEVAFGARKGLTLAGSPGLGKSAPLLQYLERRIRDDRTHALYVPEAVYARAVDALLSGRHDERGDLVLSRAIATPHLLLDDVGAADRPSQPYIDHLRRIVQARCDAGRPTYITTNLLPGGLQALLGAAVWSRLLTMSGPVVVVRGRDRRKAVAAAA